MDSSENQEDHLVQQNLIDLVDRHSISSFVNVESPMPIASDATQESEEERTHESSDDDNDMCSDVLGYTAEGPLCYKELSGTDDSLSDDWQELNKSEYAKVIFCDLYNNTESGSVGCKFQITDNVHEDPCDYVGLFRIGFENLTQCLVSKMLSQTSCEEDGKVLSCDFSAAELPTMEAGFYQFLYITRDKEICGASMPFEIKQTRARSTSPDITTEKGDDDFLLVRHSLEMKNEILEELLAESQKKNREQNTILEALRLEKDETDAALKEKQVVIESLQKAMQALKDELSLKSQALALSSNTLTSLLDQVPAMKREMTVKDNALREKEAMVQQMSLMNCNLQEHCTNQTMVLKRDNTRLMNEIQRLRNQCMQSFNPNQAELMVQLDDQKYMIKALEDSKQIALREVSALTNELSKRDLKMKQLNSDLNLCKAENTKLSDALEKSTLQLQDTTVELEAYKVIKETHPSEDQHAEELEKLKKELHDYQEKLKQSLELKSKQEETLQELTVKLTESEQELSDCLETKRKQEEELQKVTAEWFESTQKLSQPQDLETKENELKKKTEELAECHNSLIQSELVAQKLAVRHSQLNSDVLFYQNQVNKLIQSKQADSAVLNERISLILSAIKRCDDLSKEMDKSLTVPPYPSSTQESCRRKCENLAFKGKVTDIKIILEKARSLGQESHVFVRQVNKKKCLKSLECITDVEMEDMAFINELNRRIKSRDWSLLEVASAPDTHMNFPLRDSLLRLERILNAVKCHLFTSNSWSLLIQGYNGEYAELPQIMQIEMVLEEIRSQYEIQILLEQVHKGEPEKVIEELNNLKKQYSDALKDKSNLETLIIELQNKDTENLDLIQRTKSESTVLKENCTKLESVIAEKEAEVSKLSDKICNIQSKCMLLEEELQDLRTQYGELKSSLKESQDAHALAKDECMKKSALIEYLESLKGHLSSEQKKLQNTVVEHTARLIEGSELYKMQFIEIEKLKKKLKKMECEPHQPSTSSETSNPPVVVLKNEIKTPAPFHGVLYQAQSSSDSDTGEHVSGDSTLKDEKEKTSKATKTSKNPEITDEKTKTLLSRTKKCGTDSVDGTPSNTPLVLSDLIVQRFINKMPQQPKLPSPPPPVFAEEELYPIPCPICDQKIHVSAKSTEPLTSHMETQHRVSMCPICGHFFEESVPKKYLSYHIEKHFQMEGEQKTCD